MSARTLIKTAERLAINNSPTLLSALAITGTLGTAFLTGKATFKASEVLREAHEDLNPDPLSDSSEFTTQEKLKLVWPLYVPPALAVIATIGCIATANTISASRLAGMAAAYKLTESHFEEYKDKVTEKLGLKDEKRMRDEINEEYMRANPPSDDIQILATEDEVIFLEKWTGRYFRSKMHILKAAENKLNSSLIRDNYATLTDFYDEIGLNRTEMSNEIGWSLENPVCLDFTTALADGGSRPVIVMEYPNRPTYISEYATGAFGVGRSH